MVRAILAVVAGYIVIALLAAGLFVGLWIVLGVDGVLQPGTFQGNMTLNVAAVVISLIAAIAGGWMCAKIAKSRTPPRVLAGIVLVLGLAMALSGINKPDPGPRVPGLTVFQALQQGKEPTWYALLNPFLGATGVLIGCGAARKSVRPRSDQ